jgi:oligopeptide transport system substrate-binding protein
VIARGEDHWDVSLERLASVHVPASLTAVLQARLDGLPVAEKALLQRASVVGREFWDRAVGELAADAIAEDEVAPLLGSLRAREMVYRRERSAFAGTQEYTFKHSVLREVAYETVLLKLRRRYHAQVGAWLEAHAGERLAEYYGLIAGHYALAGDTERALEYLLRAGDRARGLGGYREATSHYEQALAILRDTGDLRRAARTFMKLGLTYHSAFQFDRARKAYEDAFTLWQQAGETQAAEAQIAALQPAPHALRMRSLTVTTLDPAFVTDGESGAITTQLFSGRVALTPDMSVEPDLARTWEVLDGGRKFVFHLRDDVVWSDGVPVTAGDFEYAWKRVLDPATDCPLADDFYDVKGAQAYHQGRLSDASQVGVHAQDERTLVVELEGPTSYFLQLLTNPPAFPIPRHVVQALGDTWTDSDRIVTNGAFRLGRCDQDRRIILDRSPTYHGRWPGNVHRVVLMIQDAPSRLEAYEEDALDLVNLNRLTPVQADQARKLHADEYVSMPLPWTTYLAFDAGRPPFDDRRVRRAFALATDRGRLADVVQMGLAFPATGGMVPPGMPGHSPGIGLPYDPEQARRLLAEAGFPDGRGFPAVECLAAEQPANPPLLEYLRTAWLENLGVGVTWTRLPWAALMDRLVHRPPQVWPTGWLADYVDPENFLRVGQWKKEVRWLTQESDELIETARRVLDRSKLRVACSTRSDG